MSGRPRPPHTTRVKTRSKPGDGTHYLLAAATGDRMEALSGDASTVSGRSDSRRYGDLASDVLP